MRRAAEAGFTLIELMVALVVSGIVVLGIFAFSNIQRSNASAHERNVMIQQALEGSMWTIGQDLRQAGLGFTRTCTELRIWDAASGQLINPGVEDPALAAADPVTGEHYWVLRDGVQASWRSGAEATMDLAADSLDVILGEANYLGNSGVFTTANIDVAATALTVTTSTLLDNGNAAHLAQVQQLFPPGSFVIVAPRPSTGGIAFSPTSQGQCVLLQVTSDVEAGPDAQEWLIPIDATSQFNENLAAMFGGFGADPACLGENTPVPCVDDWNDTTLASAMVVPVGRLRWSRYSIDYSIPQLPYLIRSDIIGHQPGVDPAGLGTGVDYPHCGGGECTGAGLHLPGSQSPPAAVAIGPMIEDLQVTVGCDGWSTASSDTLQVRYPDVGFEEVGPAEGPLALQPNNVVDENRNLSSERQNDEWLGNSVVEQTAPDCVFYGTAEYNRDAWALLEPAEGPAFRMSPQTLRVTLVASSEADEAAGGLAVADVMAIEDRPALASLVGIRQRFTLSERYSPENLRWRDPRLQ
jgi:prepilin-type N-terminal cleavage/methylation domain-containing protein